MIDDENEHKIAVVTIMIIIMMIIKDIITILGKDSHGVAIFQYNSKFNQRFSLHEK